MPAATRSISGFPIIAGGLLAAAGVAAGLLAAAGVYTEAHRAPDQS